MDRCLLRQGIERVASGSLRRIRCAVNVIGTALQSQEIYEDIVFVSENISFTVM